MTAARAPDAAPVDRDASALDQPSHATALFGGDFERWQAAGPAATTGTDLAASAESMASFVARGEDLLARLPPRARRTPDEAAAAQAVQAAVWAARARFLSGYAEPLYRELTGDYARSHRAEALVYDAAERYPWLAPTRARVVAERDLLQKHKDGAEVDQGLLLSSVLAHPRAGAHLVHAMLRPREASLALLDRFRQTGRADLGTASVERRGTAGYVTLRNPRYLNAEDDSTTEPLETCVDLVCLDPRIEVGILRGGVVDHPKYAGRRIFSSGINLTHLYHGKISFLFYVTRDLGYVNKLYRGVATADLDPLAVEVTTEKPWIAAVEAWAIGGGCQLLLVMDRVLAEEGAFFSLPARKEGIIPGAANLRLPRLVGDRLTRQAILFDRQFPAGAPEGRLLCDEVVPAGGMDAALEQTVAALTSSGVVSAAGNRKAIRVGQEPLDLFRQYMAVYVREQAYCHVSPQLIDNLERNWRAHERRL